MTEFKIGDKVWVKGVINQIDKGGAWDLYISTRENGVWIDSRLDECIPQNDTDEKPLCLRNVLARLRELPEHDRKVWMDEIMHEFANDYGSVKYTLGYEQGKFEGAVEAEKSNKVVIPQFVADWIEVCKAHLTTSLYTAMNPNFMKENDQSFDFILWIKKTSNQETFARAWLDGYDVEPEKRYVVTDGNHLYFKKCQEDVEIVILVDDMPGTMDDVKKFDSKDEAQKVADILGWKVQEVE